MTDQDPAAFRFFNEIGIIQQLAGNQLERVLPDGLKLPQFSVLNHLVRLGDDWAPARLARAFQVTKGAMTNTLQRLEARGLIAVTADPQDGRGKLVRITPAGRHMRQRAIEAIAPFMDRHFRTFSAAEFAAALPFLQRIRATLDAARDKKG